MVISAVDRRRNCWVWFVYEFDFKASLGCDLVYEFDLDDVPNRLDMVLWNCGVWFVAEYDCEVVGEAW